MQKKYGPSNIRVNAIAPGLINTEMNKDLSEDDLKGLENKIPLGRIGHPEDIAKCVKMLIENEYITGQIITVDGGWTSV